MGDFDKKYCSGGNNFPLRGNKATLWEGGTRAAAFVHGKMLAGARDAKSGRYGRYISAIFLASANFWAILDKFGSFLGHFFVLFFWPKMYLLFSLLFASLAGAGGSSRELIHVTDWLPTLYRAAGGDTTNLEGLDGFDQWEMLTKGKASDRVEMLYNIDPLPDMSNGPGGAIR